ncbi:conserved protein of unknown function [Methylorubrum extorquens]|uniref:Uncharacterized protein n=1 Tax=Methylorubrum extorquens TaxID=408 RepID=A0A2N9ASL7_METEX|nr:conserved protein of unknown function [Methylorubrum extorquens]
MILCLTIVKGLDRPLALFVLPRVRPGPGRSARGFDRFQTVAALRGRMKRAQDADDQPTDRPAAQGAEGAQQGAGAQRLPAEARRLHARLHHDPEEAELGAS